MRFKVLTHLRIIAAVLVFALTAGYALGPAGTAFADPREDSPASCMGLEAAAVSPPGSDTEPFPLDESGGMPAVNDLFDLLLSPGSPHGAAMSAMAKLHLADHDACDAAVIAGAPY